MNLRIAGIELRRSAAPWIGAFVAALAWAWTTDPERWDGLWMATVLAHQSSLWLLCPLALMAGAWQGRRNQPARMTELVMSTPRGAAQSAPLAVVLAGCLAVGYALSLLDGVVRAARTTSYQPAGWYWPVLVGVLGLAAAGVLGLWLGRVLSSRLTAPLLALGALVAVVVSQVLWQDSGPSALLLIPGRLSLPDVYSAPDWRTNAGQAVWFFGVSATSWVLLSAGTRLRKWIAVLPVVLSLAVALAVLPPPDRAVPHDTHAVALVCAEGQPRVCVTRLYEPVLPQLVGPARQALTVLGRLPHPPTAVIQHYGNDTQSPGAVALDLTVLQDGTVSIGTAGSIEEGILEGAGTRACGAIYDDEVGTRVEAARVAAGLWLRGADAAPASMWSPLRELVDGALATMRTLPEDAQVARVGTMRDAALDCRLDLYDVLTTR
ncbi:hypothetical protein [Catellatospora citrea]|uniref:Uncharacterized protein n=1 Tax=Catellatospora citrea TaxID=53366 RepID=A0A8J3KHC4_9ACTN|nr:hypothetical protein [Catellatospora citrea]RKE12107.1 hypothetical protein C8E86_7043 [Catellatospora citrea]GIF98933.1 hypothetical protein Cci01nite_40270 [Catellatospora citrea]